MHRITVVAVLAVAALAVGATQFTRILNLNVLGKTVFGNVAETHAVSKSLVADVDYDFASSTIVCTDTPAVTLTGAAVGAPCFVGIGPRDGGTQIVTANSTFSCFVDAVDTVKLRHCAVGTAANPADAGYVVRVVQ